MLVAIQWFFIVMQSGMVPAKDAFGNAVPDELMPGSSLGFSAVLHFIKGDWMEHSKTLGLAGWSLAAAPCSMCMSVLDELHCNYRSCSTCSLPWPLRKPGDYDASCKKCEIVVTLQTIEDRRLLVRNGGLRFVKKKSGVGGLLLTNDVPEFKVKAGDRMEPSETMIDVADIFRCALPVVVVFWRYNVAAGTSAVLDSVRHRCPLFCDELASSPVTTLAIDSLHTYNYGPLGRWVSAVIWRIIAACWTVVACMFLRPDGNSLL